MMTKLFPTAALLCAVLFHLTLVEAGFRTDYAVLLAQAKGVIPNAHGAVNAKVATNLALTVQFGIVAGTGYAAGTVTATTNTKGQIVRLTKGKQFCSITYATPGAVGRVTCATSRRQLEDTPVLDEDETHVDEERTGGEFNRRVSRRLASCASCTSLVTSTFSSKVKALCGTTVASKIPSQHRWAKSTAAALCSMSTKLGKPSALATQTCRCCSRNAECPSGVCSGEVCLAPSSPTRRPTLFPTRWPTKQPTATTEPTPSPTSSPTRPPTASPTRSPTLPPSHAPTDQSVKLGNGAPCRTDDNCANGICSIGSYKHDDDDDFPEDYICCPSNDRFYNDEGLYCVGFQELGAECSDHRFCKSGVCSGRVCVSELSDIGGPCHQGMGCHSDVCSEGVCIPHLLGNGERCPDGDPADCENESCGRISYPSGEYVCCPSNFDVTVRGDDTFVSYCGFTSELGEPCGHGGICKSGFCSENVCIADAFETGDYCPDGNYDDCQNLSCGRIAYPAGDYVCCPNDSIVYDYDLDEYFCSATSEVGGPCGEDEVCKSGVCSGNVCIAQKLGRGELCPDGDYWGEDCENGSCARSSYPSGDLVCCPSDCFEMDYLQGASFCCHTAEIGGMCGMNSVCKSRVCSDGVCIAEKIGVGEPCPDGDDYEDCKNGSCGRISFPDGAFVCCPSGSSVYDEFINDSICTATQAIGEQCSEYYPEVCASGYCSEGTCAPYE